MSTVIPSSCIQLLRDGCMDISEVLPWGWDATKQLRRWPGDSIINVDWTIAPELSGGTPVLVGAIFYVPISNASGMEGGNYPVIADATTMFGNRLRLRINIQLNDITL